MTDTCIVIGKRAKGNLLRLVCPYCERAHTHGDGGRKQLYYYRGSHCPGDHRWADYCIIVLDEIAMTETEFRKLFADMDTIADDPAHDPADYQIHFRRLQKERFPDLTREQFLDLFKVWGEQHADKLKAAHEEAVRNVIAFAQAAARIVPRGAPFRCVCGATGDPSDPAFERIHRPHCYVAGLDKVTDPKSMVRWRMVR